jgi:hypothetical protein
MKSQLSMIYHPLASEEATQVGGSSNLSKIEN